MRRFLSIAFISLTPFTLLAQQLPENTEHSDIWYIPEMTGSAVVVIFKPDSALVQKDSSKITFAVKKQNNIVRIKDPQVNAKVLDLLGLHAAAIDLKYKDQTSDLLPVEKLLTTAATLPHNKLLLEDSPPTPLVRLDSNSQAGFAPEEPVNTVAPTESNSNPWLYAIGALILGFLSGWLLKPRKKEITTTSTVRHEEVRQEAPPAPDKAWSRQIAELEAQVTAGREELTRLKAEDQQYYNAIFDQLLLPLQDSLEHQKKSHLLAQMVTATVLLNSLTRHKMGKKGKYDDANLNLLSGTITDPHAPLITGDTPPDQIPQHLRTLIALLQENHISGLGDLVVQGYRIKDL